MLKSNTKYHPVNLSFVSLLDCLLGHADGLNFCQCACVVMVVVMVVVVQNTEYRAYLLSSHSLCTQLTVNQDRGRGGDHDYGHSCSLFVDLSVCLHVCLYLSVCHSVSLTFCLSLCLSLCLPILLSICLSIYQSVCQSVNQSSFDQSIN